MAEDVKIDQANPEAEVMDVVKSIADNQRATLLMLYKICSMQDQVMLWQTTKKP